jgi:hypothetical protein
LAGALHGLRRHQEELEVALETGSRLPDQRWSVITQEIQARVGLGQVAEVERLVVEAEGLRPPANVGTSGTLSRAAIAAREFMAHGQADAAARLAERGARWFERELSDRPGDLELLEGYALLLSSTGQWQAELEVAGRLLAAARAGNAGVLWIVSGLVWGGEAAARLGHRDSALSASRQLIPLDLGPGVTTYYRSFIHAGLGDTLTTMAMLREAYEAGNDVARAFHVRHRDPPGILLREYPAYLELTRARD